MNVLTTPLLRRSLLLPGESLPSFLIRLAHLNYFDPPQRLERMCLTDWDRLAQTSRPVSVETFERMAVLTRTEPLALYATTAHRFASILTPPDRPAKWLRLPGNRVVPCLMPQGLSYQLRPDAAAQFCSDCLQAAPYHRLAWALVAVSACLSHQKVLIDQCPHCRNPVSIRAVVETHCDVCGMDLRRARAIPIRQDEWGLRSQQAIQSWLLDARPAGFQSTASFPEPSPVVLYHFVEELRLSLRNVPVGWKHMHKIVGGPRRLVFPGQEVRRPSPDQSYRLFATAFKSLLNWPVGFHEFLRAFDDRGEGYAGLDPIYLRWFEQTWRHPAFQLIRESFEEYLVSRSVVTERITRPHWHGGRPARAERYLYARIDEAAQLLKLSPDLVQRLAKLGRLGPLESPSDSGGGHQYLHWNAVFAFHRQWNEALTVSEAAWWLGIPVEDTRDLAQAGLLITESGLGGDTAGDDRISKQSLADLWSGVIAKVCITLNPPLGLVDLAAAAQMANMVDWNSAKLIQQVTSGKLTAYRLISVSPSLETLLFSRRDLQRLFRTCRRKARGPNTKTAHRSA